MMKPSTDKLRRTAAAPPRQGRAKAWEMTPALDLGAGGSSSCPASNRRLPWVCTAPFALHPQPYGRVPVRKSFPHAHWRRGQTKLPFPGTLRALSGQSEQQCPSHTPWEATHAPAKANGANQQGARVRMASSHAFGGLVPLKRPRWGSVRCRIAESQPGMGPLLVLCCPRPVVRKAHAMDSRTPL